MQNVGHAWSGTGKEVGTVSPGALNGLLLMWSRLHLREKQGHFQGVAAFSWQADLTWRLADRWCRECPGDGARLRNKKAAEWDSRWSGAVDQSPWKSGSPWGKLWDDPPGVVLSLAKRTRLLHVGVASPSPWGWSWSLRKGYVLGESALFSQSMKMLTVGISPAAGEMRHSFLKRAGYTRVRCMAGQPCWKALEIGTLVWTPYFIDWETWVQTKPTLCPVSTKYRVEPKTRFLNPVASSTFHSVRIWGWTDGWSTVWLGCNWLSAHLRPQNNVLFYFLLM